MLLKRAGSIYKQRSPILSSASICVGFHRPLAACCGRVIVFLYVPSNS